MKIYTRNFPEPYIAAYKNSPYDFGVTVGIGGAEPYITCVGKGASFILRCRTLKTDL